MERKAYAKINLTLDVTGQRPDGYHTVRMVMQSVGLHDVVRAEQTNSGKITLACNLKWLPTDERNLAVQAAQLFYAETGLPVQGLAITIEKNIPVAAGLAGGSTDAAAVLRLLNDLHGAGLSDGELCALGLRLGADIPYCLLGGSMLAEGIGEELRPLPAMPAGHVVLCKPPFSVSTAEVYRQMNGGNLRERPDTAGMLRALEERDWNGICHRLYNVMEAVTGRKHPEIAAIRETLLSCGADGAVMSGSGPTMFGLFSDRACAERAYAQLKSTFADTFLTEILP